MSVTVVLNESHSVFTDTEDPIEFLSEEVPEHRGVLFDFTVMCIRDSDGAVASWHKEGRARRFGSGDVEIVGDIESVSEHKDAAASAWDLQVQVSTNRILVIGTGPNSEQHWYITGTLIGYDYAPE